MRGLILFTVLAGGGFGADSGSSGPAVAAALGLAGPAGLSLEGEVGATALETERDGRLWVRTVTGSVVWRPLQAPVRPYVSAGAALADFTGARWDDRYRTLVLGGGVEAGRGRVGVRADLRHIHVDNAPNVWRGTVGIVLRPTR